MGFWNQNTKAQGFSLDLLIAVVIFILILTVFYSLLSGSKDQDTSGLEYEADVLSSQLDDASSTDPTYVIIKKGEIDPEEIEALFNDIQSNYETVKEDLDIKGDFCIFLQDQEGNLIPVGLKSSAGNEKVSLGEDDFGDPIKCNENII